ncbi:acyl carrier protein [Pelagicoccus albus]|uniref:Acyl carrier protein n=1 Tax=Pelagicoccus albus TaxID=415222 RepID=A0A7X1B951_9BACT|nr:acyl carrier protein [Pelagicoccus albus]MBC2607977.1 acyl carrier protein [Pelagicoccus albus]
MTSEDILVRIHKILTIDLDLAEGEEIAPDTNLIAEGFLDSINAMRLVSKIESEFDTKIPPRDLVPANFLSEQAMADYLARTLTPS